MKSLLRYEYIRLQFDFGDLSEINKFSLEGWRVLFVVKAETQRFSWWALLERPFDAKTEEELKAKGGRT